MNQILALNIQPFFYISTAICHSLILLKRKMKFSKRFFQIVNIGVEEKTNNQVSEKES